MVNGYGYHLPDRIIKPAKMVQTPTAGVLFLWVCRDSREAAQGGAGLRWRPQSVSRFEAPTEPAGETSPLLRQSRHIGARGKIPVRRQALGRAHTPVRVYKCALVAKGLFSLSFPRLVFSKTPALVHSSGQAGEARRLPRQSCSLLPAQCFQRLRPGR